MDLENMMKLGISEDGKSVNGNRCMDDEKYHLDEIQFNMDGL
jgi:hypothetical protein